MTRQRQHYVPTVYLKEFTKDKSGHFFAAGRVISRMNLFLLETTKSTDYFVTSDNPGFSLKCTGTNEVTEEPYCSFGCTRCAFCDARAKGESNPLDTVPGCPLLSQFVLFCPILSRFLMFRNVQSEGERTQSEYRANTERTTQPSIAAAL